MYVKELRAVNFRNIEEAKISFDKGINLLFGENAAGKTNALEALYLFASAKSLRQSSERDFIRRGFDFANISLDYVSDTTPDTTRNMAISYLRGNKKNMRYGGMSALRVSEFLGHFRACAFTPDDISLIKGAPEERRRFIDISISQISPRFVHCLNSYMRLLSQKNLLLRRAQAGETPDKVYLSVLNEKLSDTAAVIIKQRFGFCQSIYKYAKSLYGEISKERESFGMRYISQTKKNFDDEKYTKEKLLELFEKTAESEIKSGMATVGPHRDDVYFYIGEGSAADEEFFDSSHTARYFGSRGQVRSAVLALKLSQGELFHELLSEYPAFLLDDVFSELDTCRREFILERCAGRQVIITCCDSDILGDFRSYNGIFVKNGKYSSV